MAGVTFAASRFYRQDHHRLEVLVVSGGLGVVEPPEPQPAAPDKINKSH